MADSVTKPAGKVSKIDAKLAAKLHHVDGLPLNKALVQAGMSPTQAKKGWLVVGKHKSLRKEFGELARRTLHKLEALGKEVSPRVAGDVAKGVLVEEMVTASASRDRLRAVELTGKRSDIRLFEPDTSISVFNLEIPSGWESRYATPDVPVLDAVPEPLPILNAAPIETVPTALSTDPVDTQLSKQAVALSKRIAEGDKQIAAEIQHGNDLDKARQNKKEADYYDKLFAPSERSQKAGY
jgi:hypothetical protein